MKRKPLLFALALAAAAAPWLVSADEKAGGFLIFTAAEVQSILRHGPWPPEVKPDPSNRVSGNADAADLGERLFFDQRLSPKGTVSCGSCHVPERTWTDGLKRGVGLNEVDRNTPHLMNMPFTRWFGWDGAADSLWAQSMRPVLDKRELGATPKHVADVIRSDPDFSCRYEKSFGRKVPADDEVVLVDVAKTMAAFQETLISGRTPFDAFRDAVAARDELAASRFSEPAQRGLKIFVGRGQCVMCHTGPNFTNGEFASIGLPFFAAPGRVDPGRLEGIKQVKSSRFNLLGPYNDDPQRTTATATQHVEASQRNYGEFKVPSLRDLVLTGPYMHNGQIGSLREVVQYYSEKIDPDRLHSDGQQILRPLKLSARETDDLIVFLETLTNHRAQWRGKGPNDGPACP
jgi:cytochrome c peroxidase